MSEEYGNNGYNGYPTTGSDMNNTANNEHQGSGAYGQQTAYTQNSGGDYQSGHYAGSFQNSSSQEQETNSTTGYQNSAYTSYHISGDSPKKKPEKKRKGGGRKAAKAVACLLVIVLVGGIGFYAGGLRDTSQKQEANATPQPDEKQQEEQKELIPAVNTNDGSSNVVVNDVSDVVEAVMPSVVSITNAGVQEVQTFFGTQQYTTQSSGSGIIIGQNDDELLIVTNNHVIADSQELSVAFADNSVYEAYVKGADPNADLAVVAVKLDSISDETKSSIKTAALGDSNALKVGEAAIAIGNALGYGQSVTTGVISALDRQVEGYNSTLIQTDAAINPGNSGGALLNTKGQVIGINVMKLASDKIEGMGYAIPISNVSDIIDTLMNRETRSIVDENERGYLGISGLNVTDEVSNSYAMPQGAFVVQVYDDSAASNAGIHKGDIITKFDGLPVTSMESLSSTLEYYKKGETVDVAVQSANNGEYVERTISVTLGEKPAENNVNTNQ